MDNDSDYRSQMEQSNGYEIVEAIAPIAAAADEIMSTYIEQIALVAITLRFESEMSGDSHAVMKTNTSVSRQVSQRLTKEFPTRIESAPQATLREAMEGEQVTRYLLENLRSLVRKTDRVFLLEDTIYFLLPGANLQGGKIVQSRLWEALLWHVNTITHAETTEGRNLISRNSCSITIGHSAYPIPCTDINEFIRAASVAVLRFERQSKLSEGHKRRKGRSDMEVSEKEHKGTLPGGQVSHPGQQTGLLELENVDEELPVLARKLGIPYLSLLPSKLPADIKQLVDPKLAHELHCYPLGRERNMLTVAMLNPQDRSALDRLHRETGLHIFPVLTHPQALQRALEQLIC
jgi:hypothetical protein